MKITGMYPAIACKNSDELIEFAENKLGFKIAHKNPAMIGKGDVDYIYNMENENKVRFDIVHIDIDHPVSGICVVVDDFDEALAVFKEEGYHALGQPTIERNAKKAPLKKEDGLMVFLIQHLS